MRHPIVIAIAALGCAGGPSETPAPAPAPAAEPAPAPAAEPAPAPAATEPAPAAAEPAEGEVAEGEVDLSAMSDADALAWMMTAGEDVYLTGGSSGVACVTCHMANGQGVMGAFPPLVGAEEVMGSCEKHAGYIVHGLQGPIEVGGMTYNGVMPAQANLSDLEIAAVITYERKSWGNDYSMCRPAHVATARATPPG